MKGNRERRHASWLGKMVCPALLLFLTLLQTSQGHADDKSLKATILGNRALEPLTLYGVHADLELPKNPPVAVTYRAFRSMLEGVLTQYATPAGVYQPDHVPQAAWGGLALGLSEVRRATEESWEADPNQSDSELYTNALPSLLAYGAGTLINPAVGLGVGVASRFGALSAVHNNSAGEQAEEIINGNPTLALAEPDKSLFADATWVFMNCTVKQCVNIHDQFFQSAMEGVSISASVSQRVHNAPELQHEQRLILLEAREHELETKLDADRGTAIRNQPSQSTSVEPLPSFADFYAQSIQDIWSQAQSAAGAPGAQGTAPAAQGTAPAAQGTAPAAQGTAPAAQGTAPPSHVATTSENIQAGTDIVVVVATLAGKSREAKAAGQLGSAVAKFVETTDKHPGVNLLTAASAFSVVGAIALAVEIFGPQPKSDSEVILEALAQISKQIAELHNDMIRSFYVQNANALIYANRTEFGLEHLGAEIDLLQVNLGWFSQAQRSQQETQAAADYLAAEQKLGSVMDRCQIFSGAGSTLSANDFAWCEQTLYESAQYGTGYGSSYSAAVFPTAALTGVPNDPYRFNPAYAALASTELGGPAAVLTSLANPSFWEQYSLALLVLYARTPPVSGVDVQRRVARLSQLAAFGQSLDVTLSSHLFKYAPGWPLVAQYFTDLNGVAATFAELGSNQAVVTSSAVPESVTQDVNSLPTAGEQRNALEAAVDGSQNGIPVIKSCADAPDSSFLPDASKVTTPPVAPFAHTVGGQTPWIVGWNRKAVDDAKMPPPQSLSVTPAPIVWAANAGLGAIAVCFSEFRPSTVEFTSTHLTPWNLAYNADVSVTVSVEFTPTNPDLIKLLKMKSGESAEVARFAVTMQCKSLPYRPEVGSFPGESRMQGVLTHAVQAWDASNVCGAQDGRTSLQENPTVGQDVVKQVRSSVGTLKAPVQQALATKIYTSGPYQEAMDKYVALSILIDLRFRPTGYESSPSIPLTSPLTFVKRMINTPMTTEAQWLHDIGNTLARQQKSVFDACDNAYQHLASGTAAQPQALSNVKGVTDRLNRFAVAYKEVHLTNAVH